MEIEIDQIAWEAQGIIVQLPPLKMDDPRRRRSTGQIRYVPDLSSDSLRHSMATSALRAGADFRDIKRRRCAGWGER